MGKIEFYTDGAYSPVRDKGGWAFICPQLKLRVCSTQDKTTNNRMELTAILAVLYFLYKSKLYKNNDITIYSDSMYCIGTLKCNWTVYTNKDVWDNVNYLYQKINPELQHVKGHNNNYYNELADQLAVNMTN